MAAPTSLPGLILAIVTAACFVHYSGAAGGEAHPDKYLGINYGRLGSNLPSVDQAVSLIAHSTTIRKVKIFDADPSVLRALANTSIEVTITFPDDLIYRTGRRALNAYRWIRSNVLPFVRSGTRVASICVGNEVLINVAASGKRVPSQLVPALYNLQSALQRYDLHGIQLSTPHALNVLNPSFPPSRGTFRKDLLPYLRPLLQFLNATGAPLMVNPYPYFAYRADPRGSPLDYATFKLRRGAGVRDNRTGLLYTNLLDAQVDTVYAAMDAIGFPNVRVVVTETGWPSGPESETGASPANAAAYNGGVVRHVRSMSGTPLRPKVPLEAYIFALFDENTKTGPESEHHYGIYRADMSVSYSIGVQTTPATPSPSSGSWCVAKADTGVPQLQAALDWACGPGKADCSAIQPGKACYVPNTVLAHSSYAFNNYYQLNGRQASDCVFGGTAIVTNTNPSYQGCAYPS
ncbi:hypothetical protein SELMODRAFT_415534 [Selaginella moellendorffii]|uniref:glucan endo-1,3-beta-D-glucosidase n=2 Tax=Selaginella moellendorffii TaxID=88036 RepID=D8RWF4_SELML|nr:glucan endo-1,3-beta-glucosidase 7 [Selaginella moellendorffii]EFJ23659.1 hypothetical protein SELMODRAFT_415534 [Selaginella moellendorffii]|eukprot:XP_002975458.1 glucan endo-1,3-beta-glucosidase 7 [Selaginella moellendorffii]